MALPSTSHSKRILCFKSLKHFDNITSPCNVEIVDKVLGGNNLIKRICRLCFSIISSSFQDSFKKWCSSGVVSAVLNCEAIDFTDFPGAFQDTAVADKKYLNHVNFSF